MVCGSVAELLCSGLHVDQRPESNIGKQWQGRLLASRMDLNVAMHPVKLDSLE